MKYGRNNKGFSLMEVIVAVAVFAIFTVGVYGGVQYIFRIVYISRLQILETALLSEQMEIIHNIPFNDIGIVGGVPNGILERETELVYDGIVFEMTTVIRNIDDPFDGMATGTTPIDTSPGDYKLVELSLVCNVCNQNTPLSLHTRISPRNLEGATENGSLFIQVFDSYGIAIPGATVHITNNSTTPALDITDTVDNDGWLKVIDTPTGTINYSITVSKNGYSTDYTVLPSVSNPNPSKPPSTVVSQEVTEIYFSIDHLASMMLNSIDSSCVAISDKQFNIYGEKFIGKNPIVYKYDEDKTTDSNGQYDFSLLEWDKYHLSVSGTDYMMAGSIPMLPFNLTQGMNQTSYIILREKTNNSILFNITDSGTGLPLSSASVQLYSSSPSYDETIDTGLGYSRQTDWSGGSGQSVFSNKTKYFSDNNNLDNTGFSGDLKLDLAGLIYNSSGILESSTFDLGTTVNYYNIILEPISQPPQAGDDSIKFQIATSNSSSPPVWNFLGPDYTSNTYYTSASPTIHSSNNENRYFRYKTFLSTDDNYYTPMLSEVVITYTNGCIPPGQSFFYDLSSGDYNYEITRSGYETTTGTTAISGNNNIFISMSVQ